MEDFLEQVMFKLSLNGWVGLPGWFGGKESTCNAGDSDLIHESGRSPGKEMATHSSILAWEIPRTEEPGGLQSMGSQRIRYDWMTKQQWLRRVFANEGYGGRSYGRGWMGERGLSNQRKQHLSMHVWLHLRGVGRDEKIRSERDLCTLKRSLDFIL